MVVLSIQNLTKKFGVDELFHNVNFFVNDNDRVAIVGNNGTGKSTLLKMILGMEDISYNGTSDIKGCIALAKNTRIGYLSQDVIESLDHTLKEEALLVFKDVIEVEQRLNELAILYANNPEDKEIENQYGKKLEQFERLGGYDYNYLIEMMLFKFGFDKDEINRPIKTFSGGERTKMAFVKLLLLKPNLLILDEPTNHLDVSTIDWLEQYLKTYSGAILFVSHDRYFINEVANKVVEIEHNEATTYVGNFDSYVQQKKLNYELRMKEYNIQQKEIEKMKRFIEYFKPKPRFVARAKDREKKLEHMVKIDKPLSSKSGIKFSFEGDVREDKKIIYFEDCKVGYNETLINPFSFYLYGGDKLAIVGDNGTGKTTLLKSILKTVPLISGAIHRLHPLKIGYIEQNDFVINEDVSLLTYLLDLFPLLGEKELRNHLGKFGFSGDDVFKQTSVLSGGEIMRLVLAKVVLNNYDVLILDEPTNHLDLITKESLIEALKSFNACIIFVSHDRYFINSIANKILYVSHKTPYYHEGNYDSFKEIEDMIIKTNEERNQSISKENKPVQKKKTSINISKIEKDISKFELALKQVKEDQFKEENYLDSKKMAELELKEKELQQKIDELMNILLEND